MINLKLFAKKLNNSVYIVNVGRDNSSIRTFKLI